MPMKRITLDTCPICGKGQPSGNVQKKSKVLLRCECGQTFQLKTTDLAPSEWREEVKIVDDKEFLGAIPKGVFLGFAKRMIEYVRVFGSENVAGRAVAPEKGPAMFQLVWFPRSFEEMSPEEQEVAKLDPVRLLTFVALDPLWMKYGVADKTPIEGMELIKLASDDEVAIVQRIEGLKV